MCSRTVSIIPDAYGHKAAKRLHDTAIALRLPVEVRQITVV